MGSRVSAGLAAAGAVGPYFAWDELSSSDGWLPMAALADPDVLAGRVAVTRAALAGRSGPVPVAERVAASILSLGMMSRLVSAPLAAVALAEVLPVPRPDGMWWRPVDSGPLPLGWSAIGAVDTRGLDPSAVAAAFTEAVVEGLVGPVLAAFRDRFRLSPKVLTGNVASALGGAVTILTGSHPSRADRAGLVVERLLQREPLAGAATVRRSPRWALRRHNCCLYYRLPGGGYCGDCVLLHRGTVGGRQLPT